jgi:mono/diheme cytochrome c family protein
MHRQMWVLIGAIIVGAGIFGAWLFEGPSVQERNLAGLKGDVQRGAYVARLSGCIACHNDAKRGGKVLAGGAKIASDFGDFYAPNITPHPKDGIGTWSLQDFSRALTAGVNPNSEQHYFPAFPFPFYTRLKNQDIVDLWAAVQSVPSVEGKSPVHNIKFPFGYRQGVAVWDRLFFEPGELKKRPDKSEKWNRGRYLAEAPAHCGACHTPRNLLGARKTDQPFQGGVGPGKEKIPPITKTALKMQKWTPEALAFGLRSGIMPDGDTFGGSMAEVIKDSTRFWSNEDLAALAEYLFDPEDKK